MSKKSLVVCIIIAVFSVNLLTMAGNQEDSKTGETTDLLKSYISTDFLNAQDCQDYREGKSRHENLEKQILDNGEQYFKKLLDLLDSDQELDDIQFDWVFALLEQICRKNPNLSDYLIREYPSQYHLIAACRTLDGMQHLARQLTSTVNPGLESSGLEYYIELLFNFDEVPFEDMDEETRDRALQLLILLAVDGEHIGAFLTLRNEFEEGPFYTALRLIQMEDARGVKKPFLTDEYTEEMLGRLYDSLDDDALGMMLRDNDRMESIRKRILSFNPSRIAKDKAEKYELIYYWYIKLKLEAGKLEEEIVSKFIDFLTYHSRDTLDLRLLLAGECAKTGPAGKNACDYLTRETKLHTTDPIEKCIYPELEKIPSN